jgi:hypothetical protein
MSVYVCGSKGVEGVMLGVSICLHVCGSKGVEGVLLGESFYLCVCVWV